MPHPGVISLSVEVTEPDRTTVLLTGELSDATSPTLTRTLTRLIVQANRATPPVRILVVDLAGIGSFTPGGVSALGNAHRVACQKGIDLQLAGLDGRWPLLPLQVARDLIALGFSPSVLARSNLPPQDDTKANLVASRRARCTRPISPAGARPERGR